MALSEETARVATLRRALPLGVALGDYVFTEGPRDLSSDEPTVETKFSDLVGTDRSLVVYHMMYGPNWDAGCPMCSSWIDGLHGISHHLAQRVDFVVIAKAPLPKLRAWARHRGWDGLRILSSFGTTFNADLGAEDAAGEQLGDMSVFAKRDGVVHHIYTTHGAFDQVSPLWAVLDMVPEGHDDWYPSNEYAGRTRG